MNSILEFTFAPKAVKRNAVLFAAGFAVYAAGVFAVVSVAAVAVLS